MRGKTIPAMVLAPALLLGLPACGSGHKTANAKAGASSDLAKVRAYAKCMRQNGVDMPDPQPAGNGGFKIQIKGGPGGKGSAAKGTDDKTLQAAQAKCNHLWPNGGKPQKPSAEGLARLRAYARCMRGHGVDMPDPDPNGGLRVNRRGVNGSQSPGADPQSQTFDNADKACAQYRRAGGGSRSGR